MGGKESKDTVLQVVLDLHHLSIAQPALLLQPYS
eukprot:SAG31_NODE_3547_length_4135_cov_4.829534_3_plen_34_part_00